MPTEPQLVVSRSSNRYVQGLNNGFDWRDDGVFSPRVLVFPPQKAHHTQVAGKVANKNDAAAVSVIAEGSVVVALDRELIECFGRIYRYVSYCPGSDSSGQARLDHLIPDLDLCARNTAYNQLICTENPRRVGGPRVKDSSDRRVDKCLPAFASGTQSLRCRCGIMVSTAL